MHTIVYYSYFTINVRLMQIKNNVALYAIMLYYMCISFKCARYAPFAINKRRRKEALRIK